MIGYYVHHHGDGHAARAGAIAAALETPVTGLSSLPAPAGWPGDWVELDRDDSRPRGSDPAAGGALHYAPLGHAGLRDRMAAISGWIAAARPRLLVADVSVEVTLLARLHGVPVVVMGQPGDRRDAPHALAYRVATAVLGPWPAWAHPLAGAPVRAVGGFSRFDDRPAPEPSGDVVLMLGRGGAAVSRGQLDAAQRATRDRRWRALGPPLGRREADPWPRLAGAAVVVTHAGQNAIAEVAAARRPAVVIPQGRPFREQHATAAELRRANLAVVRDRWPAAHEWPRVLAEAEALGGESWSRWSDGDGARRAAALLDGWARSAPR